MKKHWLTAFGFVLLLALLAGTAFAAPQAAALVRQVFSGGGAPATAGQVALNASLGQPVIGAASSAGGVTLNAGFWQAPAQPASGYRLMLPLVNK